MDSAQSAVSGGWLFARSARAANLKIPQATLELGRFASLSDTPRPVAERLCFDFALFKNEIARVVMSWIRTRNTQQPATSKNKVNNCKIRRHPASLFANPGGKVFHLA